MTSPSARRERLEEIKGRAKLGVGWGPDIPWLLADIARLEAERDAEATRLEWVANHYVAFSEMWQADWPLDRHAYTARWTAFSDASEDHGLPWSITVNFVGSHIDGIRAVIDAAMAYTEQEGRR